MEDRKKVTGGGRSFNLQPQAAPVDTYYRPAAPVVEKPDTSMSQLAKSIGSAIDTGINVNDFLKKAAEQKAKEIYYNQENKVAWKDAIQQDPSLKSWNPYVDDYYEKLRAKGLTDGYFADLQSDRFINPNMTVTEATQVIDQKNIEYIKYMKDQGFGKDIISEHFTDMETFKQQRISEHVNAHYKVRMEQNKAQTISSINTELYNAENIVSVSDAPDTSLYTQILEAGAADFINEGFGSETEAAEIVFNSLKYHLGERVEDDSFDPSDLIQAASKVAINGKAISEVSPDYQAKIKEIKEAYEDEKIKNLKERLELEEIGRKQSLRQTEAIMYSALSQIDPEDVKGVNNLRKDMIAFAIQNGIGDQIGNLVSSLKKFTEDVKDVEDGFSSEETKSNLLLGIIKGKTGLNDIALAYNNDLLNYKDFQFLTKELYDSNRDRQSDARSERSVRAQEFRNYADIVTATTSVIKNADYVDPDLLQKVREAEANFKIQGMNSILNGGTADTAFKQFEKNMAPLQQRFDADNQDITLIKVIKDGVVMEISSNELDRAKQMGWEQLK